MFTMTQNLQVAHQIQADRLETADRHRRARKARRLAAEREALDARPVNLVRLHARKSPKVTSRVA
jgi:hypothetical protein